MKKLILVHFILCISFITQAQEFIDNKLVNYFENDGDLIFTHLNKTNFIEGEAIWFKTYNIHRKTNFLKTDVNNLYLTVLNKEGEEVDQAIFHVKNGIGFGQLEIDKKFTPGRYYLYFSTNYNNHNQLQYLNHQIPIEVVEKINYEKPKKSYASIDFQVLPESGYGLYNFAHRYGVKALNEQGIGVAFEADVLKDGQKITSFKSNDLGMGAFSLQPEPDTNYQLEITTENQEKFTKKIEGFQEKGGIISTRVQGDVHLVSLSQNLNESGFEDFHLLVHQAGKHFEIDLSNYTEGQILQLKLPLSNLFNGVNTLSLFYKKQPIAERLVFKHQDYYLEKADILVKDQFNESLDSIRFSLSIEKLESQYANLSASVMHQNSIANNPQHSIVSKVLLAPYIQGNIEQPQAYFEEVDFAKQYNLDLLLLNQGWSRYDWDKILSDEVIDSSIREVGIQQEIKFLQKTANSKRFFLVLKNMLNEDEVFDLSRTKTIETDKIFPVIGTTYSFSSFDKKGKHYPSPKFKVNTAINFPTIELHKEETDYDFKQKYQQQLDIKEFEGVELLDDVIVKTKIKDRNDEYFSSIRGKKVEVDDNLAESFPLLSDFLRYRGYRITDTGSDFIIGPRVPQTPPPAVIINGGRVQDLSVLSNRSVADFHTIEIDRFGYGEGMWGAGGVIRLTWAKEMRFQAKHENRFSEKTFEEGYTKPETFYSPAYTNYDSNKFQMIASLDWQPDLVSTEGEFEFSIKNTELTKFILFIEGITEKGEFISIAIDHKLKSKMFD